MLKPAAVVVLTFAILLSACTPVAPAGSPTQALVAQATDLPLLLPTVTLTPTATEPPAPTATATNLPALTLEQVRNASLDLPAAGRSVTLVDGEYFTGSEANLVSARLLEPVILADLNADGAGDAAALLAENTGGTGVFVSLLIFVNHDGQPRLAAAAFVDDRPIINNFSLVENQLVIEAVIHATYDPGCCPAFSVIATYAFNQNRLQLVNFASLTPTGEVRRISLTTPLAGEAVSGALQVSGAVTISPFENTLVYQIADLDGNVLQEGPLQVFSDALGGPGTFDTSLDLSGIPAGSQLTLTLRDLSAADGSVLALAAVEFVMR